MSELTSIIEQTRKDLQALIDNDPGRDDEQARAIKRQLAELKRKLEVNREQTS